MENNDNLDLFIFTEGDIKICPTNPSYKLVSMNDFDTDSKLEKIICPIDSHPIMKMNHSYSEASRMKWLRDNYPLKEYVGTNHYRRFFEFFNDVPDMDEIFKEHDAILPNFNLGFPSERIHYTQIHNIDDLNLVLDIVKSNFNSYYDKAMDALDKDFFIPCNMFVMKRKNYLELCDFVFSVLGEYDRIMGFKTDLDVYNHVVNNMDKYIDNHGGLSSRTTYQSRIQAFLSERLSFIYYINTFKNPLYMDMVLTEVHESFEEKWFKQYVNNTKNN